MNKYQEAIKRVELDFEDSIEKDNVGMVGRIDIERLQELVDKETPKKPTISYSIIGEENSYCPNCVSRFSRPVAYARVAYKHCPGCGQRIDWSEE